MSKVNTFGTFLTWAK